MRIQDKAQFGKENVFGLGQPNTALRPVFYRQFLLKPADEGGRVPGISGQRHL